MAAEAVPPLVTGVAVARRAVTGGAVARGAIAGGVTDLTLIFTQRPMGEDSSSSSATGIPLLALQAGRRDPSDSWMCYSLAFQELVQL